MSVIFDILATNEAIAGSRGGMVPQRRAKCHGQGGELVPTPSRSATDVLLGARMGVQRATAMLEGERERVDVTLRETILATRRHFNVLFALGVQMLSSGARARSASRPNLRALSRA